MSHSFHEDKRSSKLGFKRRANPRLQSMHICACRNDSANDEVPWLVEIRHAKALSEVNPAVDKIHDGK